MKKSSTTTDNPMSNNNTVFKKAKADSITTIGRRTTQD